jgi:RNA polymerase sigma-70 factor (ECF subfamily)
LDEGELDFRASYARIFEIHYPRIFRYFDRVSGDPDLAADLSQEAFVKLYQRGHLPDAPEAWLITVALNLFRNTKTGGRRRLEILSTVPPERLHGDAAPSPLGMTEAGDTRRRVRQALDALPDRERDLLLLHGEGYSYRELAAALDLHEASVGTLLSRAREAFKRTYGEHSHAS